MEYIQMNEFQTPLNEETLKDTPKEVKEQLYDILNNVEFIKNLISPNRPRAKDLPRDLDGKIIIDLSKPHIVENIDYFRPSALHFKKYGCYTLLRPNSNPNSEYGKWLREERRRCWEGYIRPTDGEWVTGYMYWYLNYCPIMLAKKTGAKTANRVEDFPEFWEGVYWRMHYLDQARKSGKHAIELARRGCGKSYTLASMMAHNFILGENAEAYKRTMTVLTAYQKEYLAGKDGTLSKFAPMIDFVAEHTQFPRLRLRSSIQDMMWKMGYKDVETGAERGSLNTVIGVSSKDDESKLRGKRGYIFIEEMGSFPNLLSIYNTIRYGVEEGDLTFGLIYLVGCVCAGTKVWTSDGRNINIEELKKEDKIIGFTDSFTTNTNPQITLQRGTTKEPIIGDIFTKNKECVRITLSNKTTLECSKDHPILIQKVRHAQHKTVRYHEEVFRNAGNLKIGDRVVESREIPYFGNSTLFDARLVGMLIGDGTYGKRNTPKFSSEDTELLDYVKSKYSWGVSATHITKKGKIYEDIRITGICPQLREIGIYGQVKAHKRLPINYQTLTKKDTILLLSGLYDTDGSICINRGDGYIYLTQSSKEILEQVKILWRKFGVIGTIVKTNPRIEEGRKDKNPWYTLTISGRYNCYRVAEVLQLLIKRKQEKLKDICNLYDNKPSKKEQKYPKDIIVAKVVKIEDIGIKPVYNLTAGLSHTYLANNIVTHNTAAEDASDFSSAKELMYNTKGYNIYSIKNVFDKNSAGNSTFGFFFPSYVNRKGCYNKDGVSDVTKALLEILTARYEAKYNSSDPTTILRVIAEMPITPAEAIIKVGVNTFPVTQLTERLVQLDSNPNSFDDVYVGTLELNNEGKVEFNPSNVKSIRYFPTKDNKVEGAVEIFQMPEIDKNTNKPYANRYILGHDPKSSMGLIVVIL